MTATPRLYPYQQEALEALFAKMPIQGDSARLLYQLPTGGGKTVVFSAMAQQFIQNHKRSVLILTHRMELSRQTMAMLERFGVQPRLIDRYTAEWQPSDTPDCTVAMIETLNNRLRDRKFSMQSIGLVIVDEAHHNSFQKIFHHFEHAHFIGVTATPLSSSNRYPLKDFYQHLIAGAPITRLVEEGYLAKIKAVAPTMQLDRLKIGPQGDYTVASSDALYSSQDVLGQLYENWATHAYGQKTLIFNNGIGASWAVYHHFKRKGIAVEHLDHSTPNEARQRILRWFHKTPGAVLTSVSLLTTGFDEPSVECVVLHRATQSLTLYFQMIGRGSRRWQGKTHFTMIDLGNNMARFGHWESPMPWTDVFHNPEAYIQNLPTDEVLESQLPYELSASVLARFQPQGILDFDVKAQFHRVTQQGLKPRTLLDWSADNHFEACSANASDLAEALQLMVLLEPDMQYRIRQYVRCIGKATSNYQTWLLEQYIQSLRHRLQKHYRLLQWA